MEKAKLTELGLRVKKKIKTIALLKNWLPIWVANRRGQIVPPLKFRNGLTLFHGQNDIAWPLFCEVYLEDCYGTETFYQPKPNDCIIDAGANIGAFSLKMAFLERHAKIYCFEPATATRNKLIENIERNHRSDQIKVFPLGLWKNEVNIQLNSNSVSGNRSVFLLEEEKSSDSESISCISLDQCLKLVGAQRVALFKMDIEGSEFEAFQGASPESLALIDRFVIEYHDNFKPGTLHFLKEKLGAAGFKSIKEFPNSPLTGVIWAHRAFST